MGKVLIVESPNKIKKISSLLGSGFTVVASVGHFRDLPRREMGVEPPEYRPRYEITKPDVVRRLRSAIKGHDVLLATDPDREGEAIAWHLQQALRLKQAERITFQEITRDALRQALANPRPIDLNLVRAQEARRVLDRLVGYRVSGVLRALTGEALSAGRVQTPAIRLVVDREREIRAFQPLTHYGVEARFETGGVSWKAEWLYKPLLQEDHEYWLDADYAAQVTELRQFQVTKVESSEKRTRPPAPFTTSTLQQAASAQLKLRPKAAMDLAQQLFAAGLITYHRTDSPNLSDEAIEKIHEQLLAQGLGELAAESPNRWKSRAGAQEAHEAIRPTHFDKTDLSGEVEEAAARLYALIWKQAMASQMKDAIDRLTRVTLRTTSATPDGRSHLFTASGKVPVFEGWRQVLGTPEPEDGRKEAPLPPLEEGQRLEALDSQVVRKQTKPPRRYTEATLVKALERLEIGRPSTYASIMETLHVRNYVEEVKRHLVPTELAFAVIEALEGKFGFVEYDYTREIEGYLDQIAQGRHGYLELVSRVDRKLDEELRQLSSSKIQVAGSPSHSCPECGAALRRRKGKNGFFWGCSSYPECRFTALDEKGRPFVPTQEEKNAHPCPECGEGRLRKRKAKGRGYFWGCDRYPDCRYTAPDDKGKPGQRRPPPAGKKYKAGAACPKCQSGSLVKRTLKRGRNEGKPFLGCSNYPRCDFFSWTS
jgi:DNA topoisomerase-1